MKLKGKKGVAFTLRDEGKRGSWVENLPKICTLRPYWNYSWGTKKLSIQPDSFDFLPMVWGYWEQEGFNKELRAVKGQDPVCILSFNEPDSKKQSNLSVSKVIELWPQLQAMKRPLVSPSCTNPLGEWMDSFMDQVNCLDFRVDIIGVHLYMGPNIHAFQEKLCTIHEKYNRPVLITEFAVADWRCKTKEENRYTAQQVFVFMQECLPWLEEQDWIVGYSWFSFNIDSSHGCCSALFDNEGNLTTCGRYYAEFKNQT